jgi:MtN3 and saliva related transmembrane protein
MLWKAFQPARANVIAIMIDSEAVTAVGLVAGTLTTISFLPQLLHTLRCKSAKEISYTMLIAFMSGVILWLIYGIFLGALPIILANAVTLGLIITILILKIYYG